MLTFSNIQRKKHYLERLVNERQLNHLNNNELALPTPHRENYPQTPIITLISTNHGRDPVTLTTMTRRYSLNLWATHTWLPE